MAKNVRYDPRLIQMMADNLYSEADSIIFVYTVLGALFGGFIGYLGAQVTTNLTAQGVATVVGAVVFGLFGLLVAQARAFTLRLRAQEALCQMSIEANTRRA